MKIESTADLDALAALYGQMTPGPWRITDCHDDQGNQIREWREVWCLDRNIATELLPMNAAGIVALVNAAPDLLRLARKGMEADNE